MEKWVDASTPDSWNAGTREGTIVKDGTYSLKIDGSGGTTGRFQALDAWQLDFLKGKYVTISGWVYSDTASKAQLYIDDGVGQTYSSSNSAINTWTYVSATRLIDASATQIRLYCRSAAPGMSYFDNVMAVNGRNVPVYTPQPLTDHDYIDGSATWDPGNLVDGAGETKSISVLGAALGDFVIVSAPYDLQDCVAHGYVQATDTVEIRLQNESGGAIDFASGTWKVRVFKS